ncbi:MAG: ABC transporter, partial [Moraxellaceae bacterium]
MNRTLFSSVGLGLVVVFFLGFMLANSWLLGGIRWDLTEHKLYTVSEGSRSLLQDIDEPVDFYFYFSDTVTEDLPSLRNYALRVRELLQEFEQISEGNVKLHIIDPEPFSEAEDGAAEHGLQAVPLQGRGETIYFGLVGTN